MQILINTKKAIRDKIKADPFLRDWQIDYGDVGGGRRRRIWLGETATELSEYRSMGLRREIEFTVMVNVEAVGVAKDPEANEELIGVAVERIELLLQADPKLNDNVVGLQWVSPRELVLDTTETSDGPRSVAELTVACKGQVTRKGMNDVNP